MHFNLKKFAIDSDYDMQVLREQGADLYELVDAGYLHKYLESRFTKYPDLKQKIMGLAENREQMQITDPVSYINGLDGRDLLELFLDAIDHNGYLVRGFIRFCTQLEISKDQAFNLSKEP